MKTLIDILQNTEQPKRHYLWKSVLISFIPAVIIGFIVSAIFEEPEIELGNSVATVLFGTLVISPWIETLLMIPILWIAKRIFNKTIHIALASALVWGALHSLISPVWGIPVAWVFFVFSLCYLAWEKESRKTAIVVTATLHMLHNFIPSIVFLVDK